MAIRKGGERLDIANLHADAYHEASFTVDPEQVLTLRRPFLAQMVHFRGRERQPNADFDGVIENLRSSTALLRTRSVVTWASSVGAKVHVCDCRRWTRGIIPGRTTFWQPTRCCMLLAACAELCMMSHQASVAGLCTPAQRRTRGHCLRTCLTAEIFTGRPAGCVRVLQGKGPCAVAGGAPDHGARHRAARCAALLAGTQTSTAPMRLSGAAREARWT